MTLACICGGLIEATIFAVGSFLMPLVAVWRYNTNAKKKSCICNHEHGD